MVFDKPWSRFQTKGHDPKKFNLNEPFSKRSSLAKVKEGENFTHRNI